MNATAKEVSPTRKHQCPKCPKAFKRSEHYQRHARSHNQEKPFQCRYCRRRYSRKDLVTRHEKTLHADDRLSDVAETTAAATSGSPNAPVSTPAARVRRESQLLASVTVPVDTSSPDSKLSPPNGVFPAQASDVDRSSRDGDSSLSLTGRLQSFSAAVDAPLSSHIQDSRTAYFGTADFTPDLANAGSVSGSAGNDMSMLDFFDPFLDPFLGDFGGVDAIGRPLTSASATGANFGLDGLGDVALQELMNGNHSAQPGLSDYYSSVTQHHNTLAENGVSSHQWKDPETASLMPAISVESAANPVRIDLSEIAMSALQEQVFLTPGLEAVRLPQLEVFKSCLRTYFDAFNVHLPLFHIPTFDAEREPGYLLLAMAAIGSLYRLDRSTASLLYCAADLTLHATAPKLGSLGNPYSPWEELVVPTRLTDTPRMHTLAEGRTLLLLSLFGAFSGNPNVVDHCVDRLGRLANAYYCLLRRTRIQAARDQMSTWQEWVENESSRRLLHGIIILSNLLVITYGMAPGLSIFQDGEIPLPCSDALWQASHADDWSQLSQGLLHGSPCSIQQAVSILMNGKSADEATRTSWVWSPFAAVIAMHAVAIQIWHRADCNTPWDATGSATEPDYKDGHQRMTKTVEAALGRCRDLVASSRHVQENAWIGAQTSLLFNAFAVLRVCYGRAFPGLCPIDRFSLLRGGPSDIISALHEFIAAPQLRNKYVTHAVSRALEGLSVPVRSALLVRKTAALTWSVEHALAGWDSVLLVSKWLYALDVISKTDGVLDAKEMQVIEKVYELLREADSGFTVGQSAAAELTRYWATFYEDTWVWGVSSRIGSVLRMLADTYDGKLA